MADIFVSYSHRDSDFGRRLHNALIGQQRDVWMDWEDIPFSADWWTEIRQGIESSDNFVIILSPDFVSSPVCMLEVEHARNLNKRILIVSLNLADFATASSALTQRVDSSATLQQLLEGRDIAAIARENWRTIGHVNWIIFEDDEKFDESFRLLGQTLDTDLEHIRGHTRLQVKALDWENNNRNWGFLLTGVQIDDAESWLKKADDEQKSPQPTDLHREYIKASRQQQIEQEEHIQQMQNRAKQFRRVSMIAGGVAAIITIVGIVLSVITWTQVNNANDQLAAANSTVESANEQVARVGETLTPIGATLEGAENARAEAEGQLQGANTQAAEAQFFAQAAETQVGDAQTQAAQAEISAQEAETQVQVANATVEAANATLTPVAIALTQGAIEQADAQTQVAFAENQAAEANAASTTSAQQLNTAKTQVADVSILVEQANSTVESANSTLTPVAIALTQGAIEQAEAQTQVAFAENQAAEANALSTTSAQQLETADAQIEVVEEQIQVANSTVDSANATLTPIGPTLTKAGEDLVSANIQVTQAANLVVTAETQVAAAGTQVADANFLIATAENEVGTAEAKAEFIAVTAEFSSNQAQSQSLIVNAEQAALNGDIDLALALVLESYAINPNLAQTRRLLNDIAYSSARFIFDDKPFVVFSPDSSQIAYPDGDEVVIADIETRSEVMRLSGHSDTVTSGDFSPDGKFFVAGSLDTNLIVWNLNTGNIERDTLTDHTGAIIKVAYDPSGTRIVSISEDESAIIWRTDLSYSPTVFQANPDTRLTDVKFTGDGSRFLVWGQVGADEVIHFGDTVRGSFNRRLDLIFRTIDTETRSFAMTDDDTRLIVYNANNGNETRSFTIGFNWNIERAGARVFNPRGNKVLVSLTNTDGSENELILLDVGTSAVEVDYEGEGKDRVTALAYSPDGQTVLSGYGRYLVLWDANTGTELRRFGAHLDDVVEITFSADSNHAISRSRDGNIRVWDVDNTDPSVIGQIVVEAIEPSAISPGISPDSSRIFVGAGVDLIIYNRNRLDEKLGQVSFGDTIESIFYSPTNPYPVSIYDTNAMMFDGSNQLLELWNRPGVGVPGGETFDKIATFSPDGKMFAISASRGIRVYGLNEACCPEGPFQFDRTGMDVAALAFSPDSQYLYIAINSYENNERFAVIQWNLETRDSVVIDMPHIRAIRAIDISSDGNLLLTASDDQTLVLWDIDQNLLLRRLAGHRAPVTQVFFGADDSTALSGSADATLILWDLDSGQSIRRYDAAKAITGMALNNEGTIAVSTDGSEIVTLWAIETLDEVIEWVQANRDIPPLTTEQCSQFRIQCE